MTADPWPLPVAYAPPLLSPADAAVLNAAAARDRARMRLNGRQVGLAVVPGGPPAPDAVLVEFSFGGESTVVAVPPSLFDALMLTRGPAAADPELAALLLECALAEPLSWLEAETGTPVAVRSLRSGTSGEELPGPQGVALGVEHEGTEFPMPVLLGPQAAAVLAALAGRLPRRRGLVGAVPVQVCLRAGVSVVSHSGLLSLAPGDAVLIEETGLAEGRVVVVVGERWVAIGQRRAGGTVLETAPTAPGANVIRRWCMSDSFDDLLDGEVGELRVTLVFELGRRMVSLADVAAMGPGTVLETGGEVDGGVDVLANGRRIGRGRIVQVGASLAVQLQRVHHGGSSGQANALHQAGAPS